MRLVLDVRPPGGSALDPSDPAAAEFANPIILITGYGVQAMIQFLTKSFRDQALLDAIHQTMQLDFASGKLQPEIPNRVHGTTC